MNDDSHLREISAKTGAPILIVPYLWIGDFVRAHTLVRLLNRRWPDRPVDILTSALCAPLLPYMPGVRGGVISDLPRSRLALGRQIALARTLRDKAYGTAIVLPRTWKAALAPALAGIPERTGFAGEARFGLINDMRWGERGYERMIDCFVALALPKGATPPEPLPLPQLVVPAEEIAAWRARNNLTTTGPVVTLAPGAVGRGKRWPTEHYAELAHRLAADGLTLWVIGGPAETPLVAQIAAAAGPAVRDLTGTDLGNAARALAAADLAVSNDSGLLHVAAAIGTPAIGIFGPTSPRLWAPLNPVAAILEPVPQASCRVCGRAECTDVTHRDTRDVPVDAVAEAVMAALQRRRPRA